MAPTRKKRTSSAAAAVVGGAQWKVGDLVLAKLKGYPAWPAKISEPQQWGLSSTKKKLLVYFYGTKEITFCNYADLEAFTEEKKKSLLVERHGKGADFVRAVKEIVENFDSMNKEGYDNSDLAPANNSSSLDTGGPEEVSDLANDNKHDGNPASSMDHSLASTPGSSIAALESENCVVNSAPNEPASSFSKKRQYNASQLESCTHANLASAWRPRSSLGADHRARDSCGLNGPNLPSVDMTPDDSKQECSSSRYKSMDHDKPDSDFISTKKDVLLFNCSRDTASQSGTSGNGNDEKNLSSAANVESTLNVEVCQTVMDREDNLNEMQDLPTSTTITFKRKRKPETNDVNNLAKRLKFGGGEKEKECPFFRVFSNALNSLVSKADVGSSCGKDDAVPTMKEFLGMVRECGVSEGTDVMFTACRLAVKRENREVFAGLETSAGRLHYLKSMHDEMNK